ncbi:insulinase-like peptidase [Cryptosporidium bovis]|uniref:insulinase-like peptidase n=1 Tax=Cryptosporidium bovis TaxID=310047 RepID=UPI003519FF6A|nr:insulinase-like peptidase [Cryptosporidium bovis]
MTIYNSNSEHKSDLLDFVSSEKALRGHNLTDLKVIENVNREFSSIFPDSSGLKSSYSGEELKLPSNNFRDYKYFELENGIRVVLLLDIFDLEMSVGIQYPVFLLKNCIELGGRRLFSNVVVKGMKEYFQKNALTKIYTVNESNISIILSSLNDKHQILTSVSRMFEDFDISIDKFLVAYNNTLNEYLKINETQHYRITSKLMEVAHEGSYLKDSCTTYPDNWLVVNKDMYELSQLRKRIINYVRKNMSSNLLTLVFTVPDCLVCTQNMILNTLGSMKNLNIMYPDIFDHSKYISPFSPDNIIGMKLMLPSPFPIKQFLFCFYIGERLESNISDIEEALTYLFTIGRNSLSDILKRMNIARSLSVKMFLSEKSPILSFSIDSIEGTKANPAKLLAVLRQVIYSFAESPLLERYIRNYSNSRRARYNMILSSSSSDHVTQTLFKLLNKLPKDDLISIYNPERLINSVETVLSYSTFENFFMVESYSVDLEEIENKTISIENINIEFWNAIEPDSIPSFTVEEPNDEEFIPKLFESPIKFDTCNTNITEIDFEWEEGSLLNKFNDRLSFSVVQGFQRPSSLLFFRFHLLQEEQFSIKSILFKCFIAFVMNIFLKPYKDILDYSSLSLSISCGLDHSVDMELGYDSLSVSSKLHSEVFPNILNLTSSFFNNATSLNSTLFSEFMKDYKLSVENDYRDPTGIKYARSIVNSMLNTSFPSYPKYIEIIENATFEDYLDYCNSILSFNKLKGLLSGNIDYTNSKAKLSNFINSLNFGDFSDLNDPLGYNLPVLMICPSIVDNRHFLLKKRQVNENSPFNLVLASVILEKSLKNLLFLRIIEISLLKYYNTKSLDEINLGFGWVIRSHYIQLDITSSSRAKPNQVGKVPISEFTTELLNDVLDITTFFDIKLTNFFFKTRRVLTIKSIDDQSRFDALYYSHMLKRRPYFHTEFIVEFENLKPEDAANFSRDVKNSLIYLVIIGSKEQINMNIERETPEFILTDGFPNVQ